MTEESAMFEWLIPAAAILFNYLFITVFLKYIVGKWVAEKMVGVLKFFLFKTQRDVVHWIHYREKAMGHGHNYPSPSLCTDGVCASYHKKPKK